MSIDAAAPNNSTNVRSVPFSIQATRLGLRLLAPAAPRLAARWAGRLFMTTRRHPRPAWELEVLEAARPFRVALGDRSLPAWSWGKGPLVLLVHGWEGRGAQLGAFVAPLVDAGFRVVTFDAPGHGDGPGDEASVVHFADAIQTTLEATGPAAGVIAHSMGGLSTTLAHSRAPELFAGARHVFVAPPIDPRKFAGAFCTYFGLDGGLKQRFEERIEQRLAVRMDALYAPPLARAMRAPLLVVHDEQDREVAFDDGRALAEAWPGAELLATSSLGHRRILKAPVVIQAALTFMRGHSVTGASLA